MNVKNDYITNKIYFNNKRNNVTIDDFNDYLDCN